MSKELSMQYRGSPVITWKSHVFVQIISVTKLGQGDQFFLLYIYIYREKKQSFHELLYVLALCFTTEKYIEKYILKFHSALISM